MPRKKKTDATTAPMFDVKLTTAPRVAGIRVKVDAWRASNYEGASESTRCLLNYWFHTDHRLPDGRKFAYPYSQQWAIETLIYLYEIAKTRRQKTLIETFSVRQDLKLRQYDDFARYCVKMATGSGKTKVMALAIAWQYFNAVAEGREDRGEAERASSEGALYLTNVQQVFDPPEPEADEPDIMTSMLGPAPPAQTLEIEDFLPRIAARGGPMLVVNDEAHHTHDEASEWNKCIRRLHAETPSGLAAQLDFTATPRHTKGQLFSWTVYDYPLKQAILDQIVKRQNEKR